MNTKLKITRITGHGLLVAMLLCSFMVIAGEESKQSTIQNSLNYLTELGIEDCQLKRLKFHLLAQEGNMADATHCFVEDQEMADVPVDVKVQILQNQVDVKKDPWKELKRFANNKRSPSARLALLDLVESRSKGSLRFSGRMGVLNEEPFWIPALCGIVRNDRGSWLTAAKYGSTALDLVGKNSLLSMQLIEAFPVSSDRRELASTEECAYKAFQQFQVHASDAKWPWIQKHPKEQSWLKAALLFHAGQTEQATEMYEAIIAGEARRPSASYRLARLYESQGRPSDAKTTIESGLKQFQKKNSILLVIAAEYAAKSGNVDEALRLLKQCIASSPEYPLSHILLAEIEAQRGNQGIAIKACADTVAYCYGWDGNFIERINAVLRTLVLQKKHNGN